MTGAAQHGAVEFGFRQRRIGVRAYPLKGFDHAIFGHAKTMTWASAITMRIPPSAIVPSLHTLVNIENPKT